MMNDDQNTNSSQESSRGGSYNNSTLHVINNEQGNQNDNTYAEGYNRGAAPPSQQQQQQPSFSHVYRFAQIPNPMIVPNWNLDNNGNPSGGYRGSARSGPLPSQQTYGNNYGGDNMGHPSAQQTHYGQGPTQLTLQQIQMYDQSMPNAYQQMGQMTHPMNPPQTYDNRVYDRTNPVRMSMPNRSFNDMSRRPPSSYNHPGPIGSGNQQHQQEQASGGRLDASLAERNFNYNNSGNNSYERSGSGFSDNYNNRNNRDNNGNHGGYVGQRDRNSSRPFHSHVGGRSGDAPGTDRNTQLPANPDLERELFGVPSTGINFELYGDIPVESSHMDHPPIDSFDECNFGEILKNNIVLSNYGKPTPVQRYAIPSIINRRGLMVCAQTGSGKKAAFLLPILHMILQEGAVANPQNTAHNNSTQYPLCLVLAPTRVSASQVYNEARKFTYRSMVCLCVVYGGRDVGAQARNLKKGCHILVATPGRLKDLIQQGSIRLDNIRYLVLDQADRMLDMGFEREIREIVEESNMPGTGQRLTLMFSATVPEQIRKLARNFLHGYAFLNIGRVSSTSQNFTQRVLWVEEDQKSSDLVPLLKSVAGLDMLVLVFVMAQEAADDLKVSLQQSTLSATTIPDYRQSRRKTTLETFLRGDKQILITTSAAALDLDLPNFEYVINFDLPTTINEYADRIARTGRAGMAGQVTSFFNGTNRNIAGELLDTLSAAQQEIPDWLESLVIPIRNDNQAPRNDGGSSNCQGEQSQ